MTRLRITLALVLAACVEPSDVVGRDVPHRVRCAAQLRCDGADPATLPIYVSESCAPDELSDLERASEACSLDGARHCPGSDWRSCQVECEVDHLPCVR